MTNKVREVVRTRERMKALMATSSWTKGIQSTGGEKYTVGNRYILVYRIESMMSYYECGVLTQSDNDPGSDNESYQH